MSSTNYVVDVSPPGVTVLLWIVVVLLLVAGGIAIIGGFNSSSGEAIGIGISCAMFALMLVAVITVINKLSSIDAYIRADFERRK